MSEATYNHFLWMLRLYPERSIRMAADVAKSKRRKCDAQLEPRSNRGTGTLWFETIDTQDYGVRVPEPDRLLERLHLYHPKAAP